MPGLLPERVGRAGEMKAVFDEMNASASIRPMLG